MAITGITSVDVDLAEYSQYERGRDTITVNVKGTPAQPLLNDRVVVEIRKARRNRDVVVTQYNYDFDGVVNDFDTNGIDIEFFLPDIVTAPSLFRKMRQGQYYIYAYDSVDPDNINESSDDFDVSIVTVGGLRENFLYGLDLQCFDVRGWKLNPRTITGVTLKEVSRNHPLAMFPLNVIVDANAGRFLSWGGGPPVRVSESLKQTYILPTSRFTDFVLVEVNPRLLPTSTLTEVLLVEERDMLEQTIRDALYASHDYLESSELQLYLEPTRCVTDVDPTQITFSTQDLSPIIIDSDWDAITTPVTFYKQDRYDWIQLQMPFRYVLEIDQLFGAMAGTRITDIPLEWIEISESNGFVQLVPLNQEVAFDFLGVVFVSGTSGYRPLPNFWHYSALAGLREVTTEIRQWLSREAAINILTEAGQAFRSGMASTSISRDGVSESISYTASAIYGIYSASIEDHRRWIRENGAKIRDAYRGIPLTVV